MEKDVKITYITIIILIFFLGGIAYFLQDTISLPQVQIKETTIIPTKKTRTTIPTKPITTSSSTNGSTTMQIPEKITSATITTNKGVIEITFATNTPVTVKNFETLATSGFYEGTRFHRVIRDFMIQGGDPLSKDVANKSSWGTGGPGYTFKDEFHPNDAFPQGTVAMAKQEAPNTNGSQFFIVTAIAGTPWLVGKHTVFGHITKGLDVALKINEVETGPGDVPLDDVIVEKIEIH